MDRPMITDVSVVTVLVEDQDEALAFWTGVLGFEVVDDVEWDDWGRWLTVAPPGDRSTSLSLLAADTDEKRERVGSQVGSAVAVVFGTDDLRGSVEKLRDAGVTVRGEPVEQPWGTEVEFEDPYGNVFELLEPSE